MDKFEEIQKYKELLDKNIITEDEFTQKKEELLDNKILSSENQVKTSKKVKNKRPKKPLNLFSIGRLVIGIYESLEAVIVLFVTVAGLFMDQGLNHFTDFTLVLSNLCGLVVGIQCIRDRNSKDPKRLLVLSYLFFASLFLIKIGNGTRDFFVFDDVVLMIGGIINLIDALKNMGDDKKKKIKSIAISSAFIVAAILASVIAMNSATVVLNLKDGTTCNIHSGKEVKELYNKNDGAIRGATFEMDASVSKVTEEFDDGVYVGTSNGFMFYDDSHKKSYWIKKSKKGTKFHIKGKIGSNDVIIADDCMIIVESIKEIN